MPPSQRHAAGRRRATPRVSLRLETLEDRLPLAGNVVAELLGNTLRLTGDTLDNEVVVASVAGGRIAVLGVDTTVNGAAHGFVTSRAVTGIVADLRGGSDAIGFGNSAGEYAATRMFIDAMRFPLEDTGPAPLDVDTLQAAIDEVAAGVTTFSIPGSLAVTTAGGDDAVVIGGHVGGPVAVNLGPADDGNGLVIGAEAVAIRVGGPVTIRGGRADDIVAIGNVTVAGGVTADLGDGMNLLFVAGEADTPTVVGSLGYAGGAGTDIVGIVGAVTVRSDVRIATGSKGEDSVGLYASDAGSTVRVLGNVVVNTGTGADGDSVDVAGAIRGTLSVTTGSGQDAVSVSSSVAWAWVETGDPMPTATATAPSTIGLDLVIDTGAGDDLISVGAATVARNVTIDAGAGRDAVRIDGLEVRRNLVVRLGAGDDALTVANLRATAAFLDGGGGVNTLSMDGATSSAPRKLWIHRFQILPNDRA